MSSFETGALSSEDLWKVRILSLNGRQDIAHHIGTNKEMIGVSWKKL